MVEDATRKSVVADLPVGVVSLPVAGDNLPGGVDSHPVGVDNRRAADVDSPRAIAGVLHRWIGTGYGR